jgi:primosomal protein N''
VRAERAYFLAALHDADEEQVESLGVLFALYEKELLDQVAFLRERLGDLTVVGDPALAREIAAEALRESEFRWE